MAIVAAASMWTNSALSAHQKQRLGLSLSSYLPSFLHASPRTTLEMQVGKPRKGSAASMGRFLEKRLPSRRNLGRWAGPIHE